MYMTLDDLRTKFMNDQAFAVQFVADAKEVYGNNRAKWAKVDILNTPVESDNGAKVDEVKLYGNNDLLNTYIEVVTMLTKADDSVIAKKRLPSYTHAPFNEPIFEVDTNTRVISIPNEFQKNGVGVVGDHLAEIIYFHIPRFYDVVDLFPADNGGSEIYIYWYNNGEKGLPTYHKSVPYTTYTEGDVLIVGWAISQEATAYAGTIEFSIEFTHDNGEGAIDFRLETQPAKLTIKNTIVLDKEEALEDNYNDIIYKRAIYNPFINSLTAAPARITKNLIDLESPYNMDEYGHADFDPETNNITLHIEAVSPEVNSTLVYNWNWNNLIIDQPNGVIVNSDTLPSGAAYILDQPKEVVFRDPELLASENSINPDNYSAVAGDTLAAAITEEQSPSENGWYELNDNEFVISEDDKINAEKTYYVCARDDSTYKTLTINVPGTYQVYVGNKTTDGGIRYVYSDTIIIDSATTISINNTLLPGSRYIKKLTPENHEVKNFAYAGDSTYPISVEVNGANGTIHYKWHKFNAISGEEENDAELINATESTFDPAAIYNTSASMRGIYQCEATNVKNNTQTKAWSSKIMVELPPEKIAEGNLRLEQDELDPYKFTVTVENIPYSDAEYAMYAIIDPKVAGNDNVNKYYYVGNINDVIYFKGDGDSNAHEISNTFSIQGFDGMSVGDEYDIDVWVVQVAQRNSEYSRFAMGANGIPAYTRTQLAKKHYGEFN